MGAPSLGFETVYFANVAPGSVRLRIRGCVTALDGAAVEVDPGVVTHVYAPDCGPVAD